MDSPSFTLFSSLPPEIQMLVWDFALEEGSVISYNPVSGWTFATALKSVNRLAQRTVRHRLCQAPDLLIDQSGKISYVDLERDTVKINGWKIPRHSIERSGHYEQHEKSFGRRNSQIRKLLCVDYCPLPGRAFRHGLAPTGFWAAFANHGFPFGTGPELSVRRWPALSEFTVAYTRADCDWFLETYGVQGPDMNNIPRNGSYWHQPATADSYTAEGGAPVYDQFNEGALYYRDKGIEVDAGIRWSVDEDEEHLDTIWSHRRRLDQTSSSSKAPKPTAWDYRPNVGLRGFHMNQTSCGGMWGGFRYFPDAIRPRLEFSPLSWEDVETATLASQDFIDVRGHFPEMVLKVFIVRDGEVAPVVNDNCCWEEVRCEGGADHYHWWQDPIPALPLTPYEEKVKNDQSRIRAMWGLILYRFNALEMETRRPARPT